MLGTLRLPLRHNRYYEVVGGPYLECPDVAVGVKMAAEILAPSDISIPTRDFRTPDVKLLNDGLLAAVDAVLLGKPLYVGCMAGRGRTGLFLAILAKAFGVEHPVEYVRKHYYNHAVETDEQYKFVMSYVVPAEIKTKLFWARVWSYLTIDFGPRNLSDLSQIRTA
jgi:hypothetical protein